MPKKGTKSKKKVFPLNSPVHLFKAINAKNFKEVKRLVDVVGIPVSDSEEDHSPIQAAIVSGNIEILHFLLRRNTLSVSTTSLFVAIYSIDKYF
jgi:hypothetical protein